MSTQLPADTAYVQIASGAEGVNAQSRSWQYAVAIHFASQQGPLRLQQNLMPNFLARFRSAAVGSPGHAGRSAARHLFWDAALLAAIEKDLDQRAVDHALAVHVMANRISGCRHETYLRRQSLCFYVRQRTVKASGRCIRRGSSGAHQNTDQSHRAQPRNSQGLTSMSWIEVLAVTLGIATVVLTVRQSMWCWPTGLVQVLLYIDIFYDARLYSDVLLQIVFVVLQLYGWYHWASGRNVLHSKLLVTSLTPRQVTAWLIVTAAAAAVLGELMSNYTDAAAPHADAFIAAASLVAQYLLARKKLESWYWWIAVDVVAIGVYWARDLQLTAGLYAVFLCLCVGGVTEWRASRRIQKSGAKAAIA
jgi:nicotinamide mononucleotide transporter